MLPTFSADFNLRKRETIPLYPGFQNPDQACVSQFHECLSSRFQISILKQMKEKPVFLNISQGNISEKLFHLLFQIQLVRYSDLIHLLFCELCLVNQLCPTLCNTMDCSLPGSSVHGILQARKLKQLSTHAWSLIILD